MFSAPGSTTVLKKKKKVINGPGPGTSGCIPGACCVHRPVVFGFSFPLVTPLQSSSLLLELSV